MRHASIEDQNSRRGRKVGVLESIGEADKGVEIS